MAKFYSRSTVTVTVLTFREDGGVTDVPADVEYRVRSLGRGRWLVVREDDGYRWTLSTSRLQRFFRPEEYECGYYSSGEPVRVYEEVHVYKA